MGFKRWKVVLTGFYKQFDVSEIGVIEIVALDSKAPFTGSANTSALSEFVCAILCKSVG